MNEYPDFATEEVVIPRYNMNFKPWETWSVGENPNWWRSYNKVKHYRNEHFEEANLKNTLNAVGGLLLTVIYYYKQVYSLGGGEVMSQLKPESTFLGTQYRSL